MHGVGIWASQQGSSAESQKPHLRPLIYGKSLTWRKEDTQEAGTPSSHTLLRMNGTGHQRLDTPRSNYLWAASTTELLTKSVFKNKCFSVSKTGFQLPYLSLHKDPIRRQNRYFSSISQIKKIPNQVDTTQRPLSEFHFIVQVPTSLQCSVYSAPQWRPQSRSSRQHCMG